MRYVVAVKQVPDTMEMSVDENGSLVRAGVPSVLNPYDEYALVKIRGIMDDGDELVVFTMAPPQAEAALRRCLQLGADRAYLLTDPAFAGADVWATARVLTAFIGKFEPGASLYIFGRQAIDGDTGQVPYEVAGLMGVRQFAYVDSLESDDDGILAVQDYGDMVRRVRVPEGSVVSFGSVDPNGVFPSIQDRLDAESKEIVRLDRVALGLGLYSVGLKGSLTRIVSTRTVTSARRNRKVEIRDPAKGAGFIIDELEALR